MDFFGLTVGYNKLAYRMVESQEKVATMTLVDSLDEQALLEALIEQTKPSILNKPPRHYLVQTPFRYPPLKHGSRFGGRFEPAIFYAGKTLKSAICESAFYSFYFMSRSMVAFENTIINHKTSFSVELHDTKHVDFTTITQSDIQALLTHKSDYQYTQAIGKQMRSEGYASFSFLSARCKDQVNIGVFDINAIINEPMCLQNWQIKQTARDIWFYCSINPEISLSFNIADFMVDGVLPSPSM